jgi:biopolymer transport protein ExbD
MALQITSMADIFTILLVFLLKGYSTGAIALTPSQGLSLPVADSKPPQEEGLQVEISEKSVLIGGKPVAKLENFILPDSEMAVLESAFDNERKRQELISQANPDVKKDEKVIVLSDKKAPYSTVKRVLASASQRGYTDFKLAVVQPGQ